MRVVLDGRYIQDHFPGVGRYAYQLFSSLARIADGDTFYVLHDPAAGNSRHDLSKLSRLGNVASVPFRHGVFDPRGQLPLARLLDRLEVDLYHSPHYVLAYASKRPCVATVHDIIPDLFPSALARPWVRHAFRALVRWTCRRARLVLCGSLSTRDDLIRRMSGRASHQLAQRVCVTPYGVDHSFAPQCDEAVLSMRQRLGLVRPYVLCLATNKPHKNLAGLVAGWARCSPGARKDTELVFAGRHDAAFPETREAIAEYGVSDTVRLLGPVPDALLPALMSGATAFCFPSLYEGFGLPVLEAMACGTPVAASNRSSLPEVVGDAGLLFDPADHEAIGVALSRLISDDKLRQRLARAGLARAHEFSWERTAQATLEGYRSVLARRSVC